MASCVNRYVWPDETVVADCYNGLVEYCKIEISKEILSDQNIATIVASERLIGIYFVAASPEKTFENIF